MHWRYFPSDFPEKKKQWSTRQANWRGKGVQLVQVELQTIVTLFMHQRNTGRGLSNTPTHWEHGLFCQWREFSLPLLHCTLLQNWLNQSIRDWRLYYWRYSPISRNFFLHPWPVHNSNSTRRSAGGPSSRRRPSSSGLLPVVWIYIYWLSLMTVTKNKQIWL